MKTSWRWVGGCAALVLAGGSVFWKPGAIHAPGTVSRPLAAVPAPPGYSVRGYVRNSLTGQPVEGVLVRLDGKTGTTNPAGEYLFPGQPAGSVKLLLSKDGYADTELDLAIKDSDIVTPILSLAPAGQAVYVLAKDGRRQLYAVGYDGGKPHLFVPGNGESFDPIVSPDGKKVLFSSTRDGAKDAYGYPQAKLYLADIGGQGAKKISDDTALSFSVQWSPNGAWFYYASRDAHKVYGIEKGTVVDLAESAGGAVFSPDGLTLAYYGYGTDPDLGTGVNLLKTVNLSTGQRRTLIQRASYLKDLRFSPDGTTLSYEVTIDGELHRFQDPLSGSPGQPEQEVAVPDTSERTYSPSGLLQAFVEERSGKTDLYVVTRALQGERQLTSLGTVDKTYLPSWDVSGKYLTFVSKGILYGIPAQGGDPRKLADLSS